MKKNKFINQEQLTPETQRNKIKNKMWNGLYYTSWVYITFSYIIAFLNKNWHKNW